MLGGIDPVIIFQFSKKVPSTFVGPTAPSFVAKIPLVSQVPTFVQQPPIPIYLSRQITGLIIGSEERNIDIATDVETTTDGSTSVVTQKGINSTLSVTLIGRKNAVGISLVTAMMDQLFEKATSGEYAVSYFHGAMTIFRAKIQSFSASQEPGTDKIELKIELTKGQKDPEVKAAVPEVSRFTGAVPV